MSNPVSSSGKDKRYKKPIDAHTIRARLDAELQAFEEEDLNEKSRFSKQKKPKMVSKEEFGIKPFDFNEIHPNSFMIVVAPRRSGKTHIIQHILEQYTRKHTVDGIFLFTKTNAGFEGIPRRYRYNTLEPLNELINTQIKVKKHNLLAKKKKDKIISNVIVVLDDILGSGTTRSNAMKNSQLLNKLSVNGRHLSSYCGSSNLMVILLSQVFSGLSRQQRLNADFVLATKIPSRIERKQICESFLTLKSDRDGLANSYNAFDSVVNKKDFNFIVIQANKSNKYQYSDYVFSLCAPNKLMDCRLTGDDEDFKPENNRREIFF